MALAIFDLDETLVAGDSCSLFCQFMLAEGLVDSEFIERDQHMMALYNAEALVLDDYIGFFSEPLSQLSVAAIDQMMPRFVEQYIAPRIYSEALQVLEIQAALGNRLLIISATAEFIVSAVARYLGITDFLAIRLASEQGFYTGKIEGVATFRYGKVIRLRGWLVEQHETLAGGQFYSDSINDLALLEEVDYPMATNPDRQLLQLAKQRNWPVLTWSALNSPTHNLPAINKLVAQHEIPPLHINDSLNRLPNEEPVQHLTIQEITHV